MPNAEICHVNGRASYALPSAAGLNEHLVFLLNAIHTAWFVTCNEIY